MKVHYNPFKSIVRLMHILIFFPLFLFSLPSIANKSDFISNNISIGTSSKIFITSLLKVNDTDTINKKQLKVASTTNTPILTTYNIINLVGAEKIGTKIIKPAGKFASWNNAGGSTNLVLSNGDYITYKVLYNKRVTVGLSSLDRNCNLKTIENGLNSHLNGAIRIFENGNSISMTNSYNASTKFKILIGNNNTVQYFLNSEQTPFYTSQVLSTNKFVVDFSMYDINSEIIDLEIYKNCIDNDIDVDGVCDSDDQCPGKPDLADTNTNGIPDNCDDTPITYKLKSFTTNQFIGVTPELTNTNTLTITKTASTTGGFGNAGGSLNIPLLNNQYIQYRVSDLNATIVGFSKNPINDYAFSSSAPKQIDNFLYTRRVTTLPTPSLFYNNNIIDDLIMNYNIDGVFKIMFKDSKLYYYCNNILVYIASTIYQKSDQLIIGFSLQTQYSSIIDLQVFEPCDNFSYIFTPESGSPSQTVCRNTNITPIAYNTTGVISAVLTGQLPAGFILNTDNGVTTLSGGSTVDGTYPYSIEFTGGCNPVTVNGTITVTAPPSAGVLSGANDANIGSTTIFTSTVIGGTWSSSDTNIATVGETTGIITGVSVGSTNITYSINGTGGCSNAISNKTITILPIVVDNEAPIFTCPAAKDGPANDDCEAIVPNFISGIIASDDVTPTSSLIITQSPPAGTAVSMATTDVNITVTDAANNSSSCIIKFTPY